MAEASKTNSRQWLYVAVVILVAVVIIAVAALAFSGGSSSNVNTPPPPPPVTVTITGINLQISYTGVTSGYLGPTSQALSYTATFSGGQQITLTLTLNSGAILLTHSIDSITINTPGFTLDSVSPGLPYSLSPGASADFTLIITVPNYNYNGPLTILVTTS